MMHSERHGMAEGHRDIRLGGAVERQRNGETQGRSDGGTEGLWD